MHSLDQLLAHHLNELAWSLWTELGVPGVVNHHAHCAVDPEALIVFTGLFEAVDPRLRELADVWQGRYGRYLSTARLRSLSKILSTSAANSETTREFVPVQKARYATKVEKHMNLNLRSPATIILRGRAIFGVSARADILGVMGHCPDQIINASQLAKRISLTKLNVAQVLNDLCVAGVCSAHREKNTDVYRLLRVKELQKLVEPWPIKYPNWHETFAFLLECYCLARKTAKASARVAAIEANKKLAPWLSKLQRVGLDVPTTDGNQLDQYWYQIKAWCDGTVAALSNGSSPLLG